MTRQEWAGIAAEIQAYWLNPVLEDSTLEAWYADVEDLDPVLARDGLRMIAREGVRFAPTGGQIRVAALRIAQAKRDERQRLADERLAEEFGIRVSDLNMARYRFKDRATPERLREYAAWKGGQRQITAPKEEAAA